MFSSQCDATHANSRLLVVADPTEPLAQLDHSGQFTGPVIGLTDRSSIGIGYKEHANSMGMDRIRDKRREITY